MSGRPLHTVPLVLSRRLGVFALVTALVLAIAGTAVAYEDAPKVKTPTWTEGTVEAWEKTPVQDGGRVKPFYTWAKYALMRMNDRSSCKTPDDESRDPIEWALDVMFHPEVAKHYECFLVETDEVLFAIELDLEAQRKITPKKKRDRYSYAQLAPALPKLYTLGQDYAHKDQKARTPVEGGVVSLFHSIREFEALQTYLDFARREFPVPEELRKHFGGAEKVAFHQIVERAPAIVMNRGEAHQHGKPDVGTAFLQNSAKSAGFLLSLFGPTVQQKDMIDKAQSNGMLRELHAEEWLAPLGLLRRAFRAPTLPVAPSHVAMVQDLEAMVAAKDDPQAFEKAAQRFQRQSADLTRALGLHEKVEMEVTYHRLAFFHWAFGFFFVGFIMVAVSWLWPNRWLVRGAFAVTAGAALYASIGITWRCILRDRPPVTSLYETVLFIATSAVIAMLIVELLNRKRIALAVAPVLGALGMMLAFGYEATTKQDTVVKLQAVLDTNFWLLLHVICISIGYMGSLLTGALGHVYVLGKVTGLQKNNSEFYRNLSRMIYGTLAFGLIFSVTGTILGGVWANDSWGRFWGWDPKENGALLIVLWQLAIIHGRLGGYIKSWGVAMGCVFLTPIVAFSWWHVNHLGIGLHSYGFTHGVIQTLTIFYIIELVVLAIGGTWWFLQRNRSRMARA